MRPAGHKEDFCIAFWVKCNAINRFLAEEQRDLTSVFSVNANNWKSVPSDPLTCVNCFSIKKKEKCNF